MSEQEQLHLPHIPAPLANTAPRGTPRRYAGFTGLSGIQVAAGILIVSAIIWGMWVTRILVTPRQEHIVSARLSAIVGDYVQAQARSATPPDRIENEMRSFMAALDREMQRRSDKGQVIMVGEAVLTSNVPDITESIRRAVYKSGVSYPRPASAQGPQASTTRTSGASPFEPAAVASTTRSADGSSVPPFIPSSPGTSPVPLFGGSDGADGQ